MTTTTTYTCSRGGRCEGDGWVRVGAEYVDGIAPWPAKLEGDPTDEQLEAYELAVETCRIRRASAENTLYPCKHCQPAAFERWAGRHWTPEHDRAACSECKSSSSSSSSRGRSALNERAGREPEAEPPPSEPDMSYEQQRSDLW